jgi:YidC/Oxa1 family membrane protein insertase
MPGGDVGLAIITLTILVKVVLYPLFYKATVTQMAMKKVEPEIALIKETYKNDQQTQTKKILEVYKTNKINPFSSFLVLLIQLPIILALFWVFQAGFAFSSAELYSFVTLPAVISTNLFGLFSITSKSIVLAILTGITQYVQTALTLPPPVKKKTDGTPNFKEDFARSMNMNMRYFMPILITVIAYNLSSAIAIYWVTSNLFSIGQEYYIRKVKKY